MIFFFFNLHVQVDKTHHLIIHLQGTKACKLNRRSQTVTRCILFLKTIAFLSGVWTEVQMI